MSRDRDEDRYDVPPPVPPEAFDRAHEADREYVEDLDARAAELVEGGVGLARLAMGGAWRTSRWSLSTSMQIAERVVGALAEGRSVTQAANEAASGARDALLELAGYADAAAEQDEPRRSRREPPDAEELRRRGAELLRRSSDVTYDEETHPAYARILSSLSPDEARILRLLDDAGPQPAVDVRSASPVPHNSELVEGGLTMIGELAGCRHVERTQQYLNNLFRLGLVWFSSEPLRDPGAYQVLEAQPDVMAAMDRTKRARTVRRSIHLTPFGTDFVATCLSPEDHPSSGTPDGGPPDGGVGGGGVGPSAPPR